MAQLVEARIDYRPVIRATDPVDVNVAQAIAEKVLERRYKREQEVLSVLARNIGTHTANGLGPQLSKLVKSMLETLAR